MIYELLEFYKKELSTKKIIFGDMRIQYYAFVVYVYAIPIIMLLTYLYNEELIEFSKKIPLNIGNIPFLFVGLFFVFIPVLILGVILNISAKKKVEDLYNIKSENIMWNSYKVINKFRNDSKDELLNYIKKYYKYVDIDYIKRLSEIAFKEAKELKFKMPITLSIFAALFIPLWNSFINWSYKNIFSFDVAVTSFLFVSMSLIFISIILLNMESFLIEDIFNKKYYKMRELAELLDEIYCDEINKKNRIERNEDIVFKESN